MASPQASGCPPERASDRLDVNSAGDPLTPSHKENWSEGDVACFEYRCYKSIESNDSDLWARSHQKVTVLGEADWEKEIGEDMSQTERIEVGVPKMYRVRFEDGHEGDACEDELLTGPNGTRPHPPERVRKEEDVGLDPVGEPPDRLF